MAASTSLPTPKVIQVDTRGAVILGEESPEVGLRVNFICLTLTTLRPLHVDPAPRLSLSRSLNAL